MGPRSESRAPQGTKLFTDGIYDGLFYRPTVLADSGPGPAAYDNEVFGPVALVTRFSTVDEAVELMAADSEYGLALGIMTADIATGLIATGLQIAELIPTGTAHINRQTLSGDAHAPLIGMRQSGNSSPLRQCRGERVHGYTLDTVHATVPSSIPDRTC